MVEIVSAESRTRDTIDKFCEYEAGGVKEHWIIDPEFQEAHFYTLKSGKFVPIRLKDDLFRSEAIEGFWLSLEWLWAVPTPTIPDVQEAWSAGES